MVGHTWIHSLLIVTGLQFTGAALIRRGHDVSFPCNNLIPDQSQCDATVWIYSVSGSASVELVTHGEIKENDASKSNRLSLTENCSLVIKQVTDQDAGRYTCRQFKSGRQQGVDAAVDLSVVTLTQHEHDNKVTLNCRVLTRRWKTCRAMWLFEDKDLEKTSIKSSESLCDAVVTFSRSSFYSSRSITSFKCEVRDDHNHQSSTFNLQPPNAATAATESSVLSSTAAGDDKPPATGAESWFHALPLSLPLARPLLLPLSDTSVPVVLPSSCAVCGSDSALTCSWLQPAPVKPAELSCLCWSQVEVCGGTSWSRWL
ncbi:uncharacterized protein LOC114850176 [Betta splendens]|uniref:Uncharacterized protein LOC114850176 n=1 Tax=Betta splendens TaxID=158456 RepID=A0A9W2XLE0_BETSP|nr:uncharacterized protein LOC114850176 [Betta splendens]